MKAGCEGTPVTFLFSDDQIAKESFVEDLSMILNTGDVPNLFPSDEKVTLLEKIQAIANKLVNKRVFKKNYYHLYTINNYF